MASRYMRGATQPVIAPVATAQAIAVGDVVGLTNNTTARAEDFTWNTDLATTQAGFVATFLGVSGQRKVATVARVDANSADNVIRIDTQGIYEFDTASASYNVGDLVGMAKQTGNFLESQKVAAVATENLAIGRVVEKTTSSLKVLVQILSVRAPGARQS